MKNIYLAINGGAVVHTRSKRFIMPKLIGFIIILLLFHTGSALAQGSIFGAVANSDASTPANGEISFYGFLDNTDEEIRIETCVGAGYDAGYWFDDFQNYLTTAPGNPYAFHFYNTTNGQAYVLSKTQPSNSFQQEDITLTSVTWPIAPSGMAARVVSSQSIVISWTRVSGLSYHVYRRLASSNGSFFRLDNTAGLLTNFGVADSFFVDNTSDGTSSYHYLLIADDGAGNLSPHSAILTVDGTSIVAPTLASISPNSGTSLGGTAVTIGGSGFDMAGATVTLGTSGLTSVVVVSPYQITGLTPAGTAGSVNVTVTNNSSALASTSLTGGFTYLGNLSPELAAIGARGTTEGINLNFSVSATDPDGTNPTLSISTPPTGATFIDNGNGTGTFDWTPSYTQSGSYPVTFYASDGLLIASEIVIITVTDAGNQPPILDPIGPRNVAETGTLNFNITASDADGTIPSLSASDVPTNATFVDNNDGTGTFDFNPDYSQAGIYNVTFKAYDGTVVDSEVVAITVTNTNRVPVLTAIVAQSVTEAVNLAFDVMATDADEQTLTLSALDLPSGAVFTDNNNNSGAFSWTPGYTQSGDYNVGFIASDGILADTDIVAITVIDAGNQAPNLDSIRALTANEGQTLTRTITASDPDGTIPALSAETLPTNATFVDNSDGTGTFTFAPDFSQAGVLTALFIASDAILADSELVTITVGDAGNQAPIISAISDAAIDEGDSLVVVVTGSDPEGTAVRLSVSTTLINYVFVDSGNGVGVFRYLATYYDAGADTIRFFATDYGTPPLSAADTMAITISDVNQSPYILRDSAGPYAVEIGGTLTFTVRAVDSTDPISSHRLSMSATDIPTNASFSDLGNNSGRFTFAPVSGQVGTYVVRFIATDQGAPPLSDYLDITITVVATNIAPVWDSIPRYGMVTEGDTLLLLVRAHDPDGQPVILGTRKIPAFATFVDSGNGSGVLTYMPNYVQAGLHQVVFTAFDGIAYAPINPTIVQVIEAGNQRPYFAPIAPQSVIEGGVLTIEVAAYDPDEKELILSVDSLPTNATFQDNSDGTGTIHFDPSYVQSGSYNIYIYASDGEYSAVLIIAVTVEEAGNQIPRFTTIFTDTSTTEMRLLRFRLAASDPDLNIPLLTAANLPTAAAFVDSGNGAGAFSWQTDNFDSGHYVVTFFVIDSINASLYDSLIMNIVVKDTNLPPMWRVVPGNDVNGSEGDTLLFRFIATDPDITPAPTVVVNSPTYTLSPNMTFTTTTVSDTVWCTCQFIPDYTQGNSNPNAYTIQWNVIDTRDAAVINPTTPPTQFLVYNRNLPPVIAVFNDTSIVEGTTLLKTVSATDPDGTMPTLSAQNLPTNSTFGGLPSIKNFTFSPDYTQAGTYQVRFIATDGTLADTNLFNITVVDAGNQTPTFTMSLADTQAIIADITTATHLTATDPDLDALTIMADTIFSFATFVDSGNGAGSYSLLPRSGQIGLVYTVTFMVHDGAGAADTAITHYRVVQFLRGDANSDARVDAADMMYLVNYIYKDGKTPASTDAADVNFDTAVDLKDVLYYINYLYRQGPPPPSSR